MRVYQEDLKEETKYSLNAMKNGTGRRVVLRVDSKEIKDITEKEIMSAMEIIHANQRDLIFFVGNSFNDAITFLPTTDPVIQHFKPANRTQILCCEENKTIREDSKYKCDKCGAVHEPKQEDTLLPTILQ